MKHLSPASPPSFRPADSSMLLVERVASAHTPSARGLSTPRCDGTRVPYSATAGRGISPAPGDPVTGLLGSRVSGSLGLTARGLPSGTRVRRFLTRCALIALPKRPLREEPGFSLAAAGWTPPLLVLCSLRSHRASWTRSLQQVRPTFQAPIAPVCRSWIDHTPSQAATRALSASPDTRG